MIVAIDGPAGSGKSTIAREIARRHGFEKLDTGAMYRAVTFAALSRGIDLADEDGVCHLARLVNIVFQPQPGGVTRVFLDGEDVSSQIRTPEVDAGVSKVSAYPDVRVAMLAPQRAVARQHDVVAEGRDIGTVVFPDADVKVFLTADPRERARRRVLQRHEGEQVDLSALEPEIAETLASIERRDALDASRDVAPLVAAADAVRIDSTAYSIEEVVDQISALIEEAQRA
ncbi:(d)CMP kinase [Collinsella sp. An2]|uniref:(d)CMP kinase n=1 Tax=Collinsella sp. An2 TaxID=1965585 RepID=UPI000B385D1F|nr:(d)CMP kinase [Collinsella sp. An2]OUP08217.1 cytidylate kinase [Collinsella sp. An2]